MGTISLIRQILYIKLFNPLCIKHIASFCPSMLATTGGPHWLRFGLCKRKDVRVYLHIEWSLETHVETHCNVRCELTYLELSTWDWITEDTVHVNASLIVLEFDASSSVDVMQTH